MSGKPPPSSWPNSPRSKGSGRHAPRPEATDRSFAILHRRPCGLSETDAGCETVSAGETRGMPRAVHCRCGPPRSWSPRRRPPAGGSGKHLTPEIHEAVLALAAHETNKQIDSLVAELAPKPRYRLSRAKAAGPGPFVESEDRRANCRPWHLPPLEGQAHSPPLPPTARAQGLSAVGGCVHVGDAKSQRTAVVRSQLTDGNGFAASPSKGPTPPPLPPACHAVVQALAPRRYRVQFTIGQAPYEQLRCLQTLLRREVPNGDAGVIVERLIAVLLDKVQRGKLGKRGVDQATSGRSGRRSTAARAHRASARRGRQPPVRPRAALTNTSMARPRAGPPR